MPTAIIYNPVAGRGKARATVDAVVDEARLRFGAIEVLPTEAPGDGVRRGREVAERGIERVLVVGGDGSVHEVTNGILNARTAHRPLLSVVPVGTGNDFAKLVGTAGLRPREAVRRLAKGTPARFDVGQAWDEYFVNTLGVGLDAEVTKHLRNVKRLRGTLAYGKALLGALGTYDDIELEVEVGNDRFTGKWLLVAVGIGAVEGGGFNLMPSARPDDGLLDICAIRPTPLLKLLTLIPSVMMGTHTSDQRCWTGRGTEVRFKGTGPLTIHADGELRRNGSHEVVIALHQGILPVLKASTR
jgi:YegS/Rv2252/BmrU family lipid kinase